MPHTFLICSQKISSDSESMAPKRCIRKMMSNEAQVSTLKTEFAQVLWCWILNYIINKNTSVFISWLRVNCAASFYHNLKRSARNLCDFFDFCDSICNQSADAVIADADDHIITVIKWNQHTLRVTLRYRQSHLRCDFAEL